MSDTAWIEVAIFTTPAGIEPLYGLLLSMGIEGAEIVDEGDFQSFLTNYTQYWDYVDEDLARAKKCPTHLNIYLRDDANGRETLLLLREQLTRLRMADDTVGSLEVRLKNVDEHAWFENWKQYFKPLHIGKQIVVVPEWETYDGDGTILRINPGMLFGTGGHNTTRLCMTLLEEYLRPGMTVFDIGCGSGILSILALLLGAKSALAVDIDPAAERIAYENAALNHIGKDTYTVRHGNVLETSVTDERFDMVLANIVADVIIPLSAKASRYLKPDGLFLCSGIINDRLTDVTDALAANGFTITAQHQDGEWWAILSKKEQ